MARYFFKGSKSSPQFLKRHTSTVVVTTCVCGLFVTLVFNSILNTTKSGAVYSSHGFQDLQVSPTILFFVRRWNHTLLPKYSILRKSHTPYKLSDDPSPPPPHTVLARPNSCSTDQRLSPSSRLETQQSAAVEEQQCDDVIYW
jgi:hypothetical protein